MLPATSPQEPLELRFLAELCEVAASGAGLQKILDWVVDKTRNLLDADEGTIRLLGNDDRSRLGGQTLVRRQAPAHSSVSWPQPISMSIFQHLALRKEPLVSTDLTDDPRFPALHGMSSHVRSVLAVPLRSNGELLGMLAVTQKQPGRVWGQREVQVMSIVAANSAGVIEQASLRAESMARRRLEEESRRIRSELDVAREIQMGMVPSEALALGPWRVYGRLLPAAYVGGDAFDYYLLDGDRLAVSIADVAGKGVPASLLMSNLQAGVRAFCNGRMPVPSAIEYLNRSVSRWVSDDRFITFFYGELDPRRGVFTYVNAGHNHPILLRSDGELAVLGRGGPPLGLSEDTRYEQGQSFMSAGDSLLLYSDGVTDAKDGSGATFGEERLRALLRDVVRSAPQEAVKAVLDAVARFRGRVEQTDDITLVVLSSVET
jgi:sigma-B regulation protein RsbU (phosphoserine phosphatase)